MMKKIYRIVCIFVVGLALVYAFYVRSSLDTAPVDITKYTYGSQKIDYDSQVNLLQESNVDAPEDLIEESPYILKITFQGERSVTENITYSDVIVDEVMKGDGIEEGSKIKIIEQYYVFADDSVIYNNDGDIPMFSGHSYLVFLREKEFSSKRKNQEPQYYGFVDGGFYKYDVNTLKEEIVSEEDMLVSKLENLGIYTSDVKTLKLYKEYRDSILKNM